MNANDNKNVEEGGTAATVEVEFPPFNSNENENSEEGAGWTDIKRAVLSDEVGIAATLERTVPPSNSNANENENLEEVSGENCVSLFPSILLCKHTLTVPALLYLSLMGRYQEIGTTRGGRYCRNAISSSPSCQF